MADADKAGHLAATLSVRDERLAKVVAERVTGRVMELLDIDERLKRLQEHIEQAREAQPASFHARPERTES